VTATTLVDGDGFSTVVKSIRLKLKNVTKIKNEVILHYENELCISFFILSICLANAFCDFSFFLRFKTPPHDGHLKNSSRASSNVTLVQSLFPQ